VILFAASLWFAYRLWFSPVVASVLTLGTTLFPPVYGMLGWVGRDVWFVGLLLATVAALGWAIRKPEHRTGLLIAALVTAHVAVDARQNALPIVMLWAAMCAVLLMPSGKQKPVLVALAAVGGLLLAMGFRTTVNAFVVDRHLYPFQAAMMRDIVGISVITNKLYLPESLNPRLDIAELKRLWSKSHPDQRGAWFWSVDSPVVLDMYEDGGAVNALVASSWREAILAEPLAYLRSRTELYVAQVDLVTPSRSTFYGVSDELEWERSDSLRQAFPALNEIRMNYAFLASVDGESNVGGPLYRVWIYLGLGIAGSVVLAMTKTDLRFLALGLLVFQLLMQALLFVGAGVAEYRYNYYQVILGIVLSIAAASELVSSRRSVDSIKDDAVAFGTP